MRVNLKELVEFYDIRKEFGRHAGSIKNLACEELSLALLCAYLSRQDSSANTVEKLKQRATTDKAWLDAWLKHSDGQAETYYQVEVKCWSFHGYGGGEPLPLDLEDDSYARHVQDLWWRVYWDDQNLCFKEERLNKVLKRMDQFREHPVQPIACLWQAVHPEGKKAPFFDVPCKTSDNAFERVFVFSASAYVRSQIKRGIKCLDLDLPDTQKRLEIINGIFS